ncbi:hypothetical protein ENSA7_81650 [Enhygromyxa salina]|uniref:Uncharacterized protein n=1 Tax=Enhygromyxa salina TaxID=215803 RepID=A0A2S9XHZ8_9BACT|nr:hypothetical protein ENSA7_81650 [Enhygromyxa salina]
MLGIVENLRKFPHPSSSVRVKNPGVGATKLTSSLRPSPSISINCTPGPPSVVGREGMATIGPK